MPPFDDDSFDFDDFERGLDRESLLDEDEQMVGDLDDEDLALLAPPKLAPRAPRAKPKRTRK